MLSHRGIARRAVTVGLAMSLAAAGVAAPAVQASADEVKGDVTIAAVGANDDMTYNVYRLFTGNVHDDNKISDVRWADKATHNAVVAAIQRHDTDYRDPSNDVESAQAAAEFIANHIGDADGTTGGSFPSQSTGEGTWTRDASFADDLSDAVDALQKVDTIKAGETKGYDDGYYLLVSDTDSVDGGQARDQTGTSPIFCVIGGRAVNVTEKTVPVTVEKSVREDSDGDQAWGKASDANRGQAVQYQLVGTLPGNLASYDSFYYEFHDQLDPGLDVDMDSVRVYAAPDGDVNGSDRVDVTQWFTAKNVKLETRVEGTDADHELSVAVTGRNGREGDVLSITDGIDGDGHAVNVDVTRNTKFVVEYTARLNGVSKIGSEGNPNQVFVEYTKNPNHTEHGQTHNPEVRAYTYQLNLHKQDKQLFTRSLKGAKFTIQVAEGSSDASSVGKYLQADGTLGDGAHEFETDDKGDFSVPRIDEGTYTIHEVAVPKASDNGVNGGDVYDPVPDFTLKVTSNVADMAKQETSQQKLSLGAELTIAKSVTDSYDAVVADSVDDNGDSQGSGIDATAGTIHVVVRDTKETMMPLTGLGGIGGTVALGLAVLAAGTGGVAFHLHRKRAAGAPRDGR